MEKQLRPEQKKLHLDLIPGTDFWLVPLVAIVEILIFFWMTFDGVNALSPDPIALFDWGANQRSAVIDGQLWRLFTALFIHRGIFHLVVNVFVLWILGRVLEPLLGWKNIGLLMLFGGLCGNSVSFFWYPYLLSVGASAMVYALFGACLILLFTQSSYFKDLVPHVFLLFVLFILQTVYGFFNTQIDHAAHIGGMLAGILTGVAFGFIKSNPGIALPIRGALGFLSFLAFMSVVVLGKGLSNPLADFQKVRNVLRLEKAEADLAWLHGEDSNAFRDGIQHWQSAIDTAVKYQNPDMPEPLLVKMQQIELYCRLNKKRYQLVIDFLRHDGTFLYPLYQEKKAGIEYLEKEVFLRP
ncbi:MAG: rhomboid family intramembrane serine protease [Bacteroidetes bacterium]|nr:rhomboid family intramembrane serine protease [Bacteroidota bacterium]